MPAPAAPLVRVERGGVEEAIHLGHLATVDAAARVQASVGNPDRLTYFRSCAKPFQAIAALRTGIVSRFHLQPEHVAIMAASHNGEPRHVEVVRDLLRHAGIPESALQCGAHWPYHEPAATLARRAMEQPLPIFNNCSGKHAGMLAGALALGAPLETYLDREHPIQQRIAAVIAEFTAQSPADIRFGIDGCSAPNPAVPLAAIARSFAALVTSRDDHAATVVDAMTRVGRRGRIVPPTGDQDWGWRSSWTAAMAPGSPLPSWRPWNGSAGSRTPNARRSTRFAYPACATTRASWSAPSARCSPS